jgi:Peptidase family M23
MKRVVILLPVLLALQVGVQPALAWTWPVDGPVLRPFTMGDDPYGAGQHRGLDIGAQSGAAVHAPAGGTVTFAGSVPGGGRTVTIRTTDGYSVTLVHLGTVQAARSSAVAEGDAVGTVGPTGDPEHAEPYVHLGIRLAADPNGYVDPLGFLPPHAEPAAETSPDAAPHTDHAPAGAGEQGPDARPVPAHRAPAAAPSGVQRAFRARAQASLRKERTQKAAERRAARPAAVPSATMAPREELQSFERPVTGSGSPPSVHARNSRHERVFGPLLGGLALTLLATFGLALRRQFRDAAPADGSATVLLELAAAATEDTRGLRLRQEDRFVVDGDFERILLTESEALPDLDGNDDSAELIEVSDDARRHAVGRPGGSRRLSRPHGPGTWPFSQELRHEIPKACAF